jgi:hypothetical protein
MLINHAIEPMQQDLWRYKIISNNTGQNIYWAGVYNWIGLFYMGLNMCVMDI